MAEPEKIIQRRKRKPMTKTDKIIMYESDEAAVYHKDLKLSGWVGGNGEFYGKDENMARYCNSTHRKCECGQIHGKGWTCCEKCREINRNERFEKLQVMEAGTWGYPIVTFDGEEYFWDSEAMIEYCVSAGIKPSELRLCSTERATFPEIDDDYFQDVYAEDQDQDDLPDAVIDAIVAFNEVMKNNEPNCWTQADSRIQLSENADQEYLECLDEEANPNA